MQRQAVVAFNHDYDAAALPALRTLGCAIEATGPSFHLSEATHLYTKWDRAGAAAKQASDRVQKLRVPFLLSRLRRSQMAAGLASKRRGYLERVAGIDRFKAYLNAIGAGGGAGDLAESNKLMTISGRSLTIGRRRLERVARETGAPIIPAVIGTCG